MKLVTTTCDLAAYFPDKSIAAPVKAMKETGFRHLDLSMYSILYEGSPWLTEDGWKKEVEECRAIAEACGFDFVQAHSPDPGAADESSVIAIRNSIKACGMLGIPHTVVHAVVKKDATPEEFFENNVNFYKQFEADLEEWNVDLLIENSAAAWNPFYFLRTGADMRDFVDRAEMKRLHICWDVGHGNVQGCNQYDDIMAMGNELRALHIHDNFGDKDSHIQPLSGSVNYDLFIKGLIDSGYSGDFTFESCETLRTYNAWPHYRKFVTEDDKLKNPPLHIVQKQIALLYDLGTWMLGEYGITAE